MDIVRFKGGLGNQMFQYAFVEALRSRNRTVKCNLGFYKKHPEARRFVLNDVFPNVLLEEIGDDEFDDIDKKWQEVKNNKSNLEVFYSNVPDRFFWVERECIDEGKYLDQVFETKNCVFVGYWQSWKYFRNIEERIQQSFCFGIVEKELEKLYAQIKNHNNYTSVHIRRTDYLHHLDLYGDICTEEYYKNAMDYVERNSRSNVRFLVFTDDCEWAKENFRRRDCMFLDYDCFDNYRDWYDMYLMSSCANNIIANSSFSWWGAWLNSNVQKMVVAPKKWINGRDMKDLCPEEWIRV